MNISRIKLVSAALTLLLTLGILHIGCEVSAQSESVTGVTQNGNQLDIALGSNRLIVQPCEADMVKVEYEQNGEASPETWSISTHTWAPVKAKIDVTSDPIVISTSQMKVTISRSPCIVSVYDAAGNLLVHEQDPKGVTLTVLT